VSIWHIITGEYPPQLGGVSDYTRLVANGLAAAGHAVQIWAPRCDRADNAADAVEVHRLPGHFGPPALAAITRAVRASPDSTVLVQYVPHAYGFKAMNLPFCLWLYSIRRAGLTVMFHEVAFPMGPAQPLRHNLLGAVTKLMARLVSRSATRIMVASARWQEILSQLGATAPITWLPIPSNIAVDDNAPATASWHLRCTGPGGLLAGHFANYSDYSAEQLSQIVPALLGEHRELSLLLLGANSQELRRRLLRVNPHLAGRLHATGVLAAQELSWALAACDLMVQPYPDGISTRRTSTSALLAHGRAIITTNGIATEPLWRESSAVAMAPADSPGRLRGVIDQMILNDAMRRQHQRSAQMLYDKRFALRHTLAALTAI
jgi:glycosyltransferase involved in cell wall biosynthesis